MPAAEAPLAVRMRPRTLDELVGQDELMRVDSPLRIAIESGRPHSAILYGPPGTGKTTLARIVADSARGAFEEESAVNAGRAEVRAVIERAEERRRAANRPTIFFLDEIHRFNKAQQDALLPAVEEGLLTLIGATTENPYFEVNSALLSRAQIYELKALGPPEIEALVRRALADPERGIADPPEIDRRRRRAAGDPLGRRRADRAGGARAGGRDGARGGRAASTSRRPRTPCSARRCASTRAAISTTTTSRPGSRPRAAPTPTPPSTTWR